MSLSPKRNLKINAFIPDHNLTPRVVIERVATSQISGMMDDSSSEIEVQEDLTKKKRSSREIKLRVRKKAQNVKYIFSDSETDDSSNNNNNNNNPELGLTYNGNSNCSNNISNSKDRQLRPGIKNKSNDKTKSPSRNSFSCFKRSGTAMKNVVLCKKEKTDRRSYTRKEDEAIVKFMTDRENRFLWSSGVSVWEKAVDEEICTDRTAYSMKERWRRYIINNIFSYNLDKERAEVIRNFMFSSRRGKEEIQKNFRKKQSRKRFRYPSLSPANELDDENDDSNDLIEEFENSPFLKKKKAKTGNKEDSNISTTPQPSTSNTVDCWVTKAKPNETISEKQDKFLNALSLYSKDKAGRKSPVFSKRLRSKTSANTRKIKLQETAVVETCSSSDDLSQESSRKRFKKQIVQCRDKGSRSEALKSREVENRCGGLEKEMLELSRSGDSPEPEENVQTESQHTEESSNGEENVIRESPKCADQELTRVGVTRTAETPDNVVQTNANSPPPDQNGIIHETPNSTSDTSSLDEDSSLEIDLCSQVTLCEIVPTSHLVSQTEVNPVHSEHNVDTSPSMLNRTSHEEIVDCPVCMERSKITYNSVATQTDVIQPVEFKKSEAAGVLQWKSQSSSSVSPIIVCFNQNKTPDLGLEGVADYSVDPDTGSLDLRKKLIVNLEKIKSPEFDSVSMLDGLIDLDEERSRGYEMEIVENNENVVEVREDNENVVEVREDNEKVVEVREDNENVVEVREDNENVVEVREDNENVVEVREDNENVVEVREDNENVVEVREDNEKVVEVREDNEDTSLGVNNQLVMQTDSSDADKEIVEIMRNILEAEGYENVNTSSSDLPVEVNSECRRENGRHKRRVCRYSPTLRIRKGTDSNSDDTKLRDVKVSRKNSRNVGNKNKLETKPKCEVSEKCTDMGGSSSRVTLHRTRNTSIHSTVNKQNTRSVRNKKSPGSTLEGKRTGRTICPSSVHPLTLRTSNKSSSSSNTLTISNFKKTSFPKILITPKSKKSSPKNLSAPKTNISSSPKILTASNSGKSPRKTSTTVDTKKFLRKTLTTVDTKKFLRKTLTTVDIKKSPRKTLTTVDTKKSPRKTLTTVDTKKSPRKTLTTQNSKKYPPKILTKPNSKKSSLLKAVFTPDLKMSSSSKISKIPISIRPTTRTNISRNTLKNKSIAKSSRNSARSTKKSALTNNSLTTRIKLSRNTLKNKSITKSSRNSARSAKKSALTNVPRTRSKLPRNTLKNKMITKSSQISVHSRPTKKSALSNVPITRNKKLSLNAI